MYKKCSLEVAVNIFSNKSNKFQSPLTSNMSNKCINGTTYLFTTSKETKMSIIFSKPTTKQLPTFPEKMKEPVTFCIN